MALFIYIVQRSTLKNARVGEGLKRATYMCPEMDLKRAERMLLMNQDEKNMNTNEETTAAENQNVETTAKEEEKQGESSTPSYEELLTQLAQANAENAKLKSSLDNTSSEAARYKRQLREKQTAQEIQDEEKRKQEEQYKKYVAELENYKRKAEAKSRYALLGMSSELADKAAEAEIKGDMDELAAIQKKNTEAILKAREAEWLKNRPDANAGNSDDSETDPFIIGWNAKY